MTFKMIFQTAKVAFVAAAIAVCGNVSAQDCSSCSSGMTTYGGGTNYASPAYGGFGDNSCGRAISQNQAAALWAGYCTENCDTGGGCGTKLFGGGCGPSVGGGCGPSVGGGCKLGGKIRGKFSGGGFGDGGSGCGCDMGCFGYPTGGCGCDTSGGRMFGGGGLRGKFSGGGCGGGCKLFSGAGQGGFGTKIRGMFSGGGCGGGCKLFSGRKSFQQSANNCGSGGAYFAEAVGYQYGTAGMQSVVSGCATQACGGCSNMSYGASPANYKSGGIQGTPLQQGNVYMGQYDPTANAQEIPGEAVTGEGAAAADLENHKDTVEGISGTDIE